MRTLSTRIAAAVVTAALLAAGCGAGTPPPPNVDPVEQDAPATGLLGAVDRAQGVSDDMDARNQAILDSLP